MTVAMLQARPEHTSPVEIGGLRLVVLARLAVGGGATRPELAREIGPYVGDPAHRLAIDIELAALVRAALAIENKSRFSASTQGAAVLSGVLCLKALPRSWAEMRDLRLVAKILGIEREPQSRIKALAKPEQLRASILASSFGFKLRGPPTPSKLRSELALVALERAFGNKVKSGLSSRGGFNAKASRLLAGQLLARPRDAGTDSRLVIALATETAGAAKPDADALRTALLRRLCAPPAAPSAAPRPAEPAPPAAHRAPARPPAIEPPLTPRPPAASRPDLAGFVRAVQAAAQQSAEGWPGNRKALVSRVWQTISAAHPQWGLSGIEFKAMLAEAHRTGHLLLATADLKDKSRLKELQDSAITYKNTVWHQIRLED